MFYLIFSEGNRCIHAQQFHKISFVYGNDTNTQYDRVLNPNKYVNKSVDFFATQEQNLY